jgi:hypothetical protein
MSSEAAAAAFYAAEPGAAQKQWLSGGEWSEGNGEAYTYEENETKNERTTGKPRQKRTMGDGQQGCLGALQM